MNETEAEFLAESNAIEGYNYPMEDYLEGYVGGKTGKIHVDNSVEAWKVMELIYTDPMTDERLRLLHKHQTMGLLNTDECGYYRRVQVYVGNHVPPKADMVPLLMQNFILDFNECKRSTLDLHYFFEHIHPFVDGNGRVGRLIWAWDMKRRGRPVFPILDCYNTPPGPSDDTDFYTQRSKYYKALQNWHDLKSDFKKIL